MGHKIYRQFGRTSIEKLLSKVEADTQTWSKEWCVSGCPFAVSNIDDAIEVDSNLNWINIDTNAGNLVVGLCKSFYARLANQLANISDGCHSRMPELVGRKAFLALCSKWLGLDVLTINSQELNEFNPDMLDKRFGNIALKLTGYDFNCIVIFKYKVINNAFPRAKPASVNLINRMDAASQVEVVLNVELDLDSIAIATVFNLKVGEVLVSNTKLESNFDLVTSKVHRVIASVDLHRIGLDRSIQINSVKGNIC